MKSSTRINTEADAFPKTKETTLFILAVRNRLPCTHNPLTDVPTLKFVACSPYNTVVLRHESHHGGGLLD